jgi:hypothetical protein
LSGPLLLSGRVILLISGGLAIGLGVFNLFHEFHAAQVDGVYTISAAIVGVIWLASLVLAFLGVPAGVFIAGAIAFVEFGVIAANHFGSGPAALGTFVEKEGLPLATVDMALLPSCALVLMSAAVCWSNPRGRNRSWTTVSLLLIAIAGSVLVILQATDDFHRKDFGTANIEDGAFAAAMLASLWLAGGLWVARARRAGALLIAVATFGVTYSFVTLHFLRGTTVMEIAARSGAGWALASAAAAVLAASSLLVAVGLLLASLLHRRAAATQGAVQPARRGA